MQTYNDVLNKIIEIIEISENIRKSSNDKKFDIENFCLIRHFPIYKDYVETFNDLLNIERTYYLLYKNKDSNVGYKNSQLLELCKNNLNNPNYLELSEIISRSFNKTANELYEYLGYFVLKEDYNRFIELCKILKVGPCISLKEMNPEDAKVEVQNSLNNNKEQTRRIKKHMEKNNVREEEVEESAIFVPEIQIREVSSDDNNNHLLNDDKEVLSCDFREIIYLGMNGQLTLKMVNILKELLTELEFKELINLLIQYGIFTKAELSEIIEESKNKVINDIDELVGYFAIKENLNINGLKALIPSIGIWNYHYMIDQLFKYGAINFEDYKDYLIENNLYDSTSRRS